MPQTRFTHDQQTRLLDDIGAVLHRMYDFRRPLEPRWAELHRHLDMHSAPKLYPDGTPRSNVFMPYGFANVRHVTSGLTEALFGIDPPFVTLPAGKADEEAARHMQPVLELMAIRRGRLRSAITDYISMLATYGWASFDVGWDWDYDLVYDWQVRPIQPTPQTPPALIGQDPRTGQPLVIHPLTGQPAMERVKVLVPVPRNRPRYTALDVYDVLVDPDGRHVAKLFDKTVPQMIRENAVAKQAGYELYSEEALQTLKAKVMESGDRAEDRNALVRVAEVWDTVDGSFTLSVHEEDESTLSYKDQRYVNRSSAYTQYRRRMAKVDKAILAAGYNPYAHCRIPILYTSYTKIPGEMFGMGVIEPAFGLNEALNSNLSRLSDKMDLGLNQRFIYDAARNVDLGDLQDVNVPGGLIAAYGDPSNFLHPLPVDTPTPGDYGLLPIYQSAIEVAASVSDAFQRGVGSTSGNKTATGIQSVIQESNKSMGLVARQISEDILEPALQMTAANIQQFITDEIEIRITDEQPFIPKVQSQFITIKPSEIAGNYDFRIPGAAYMENRFVLQNNARMMMEMTANLFPQWLKPDTTIEEMFTLHRIPYPHRFIKTPEEVAAEQAQQFQQQVLLAAVSGQAEVEKEKVKQDAKGDKSTPKRPEKTVDETTGVARQFAQRMGSNAMGTGGLPQ